MNSHTSLCSVRQNADVFVLCFARGSSEDLTGKTAVDIADGSHRIHKNQWFRTAWRQKPVKMCHLVDLDTV